MQAYGYYSAETIKKRQLARERAIAWKVIKGLVKTAFILGVATAVALFVCYHALIWTIDGQIDQSNIQNCEDLRTVQLEQWQKAKGQCQQYYDTGNIEYLRNSYQHVDNYRG